MKIGLLTKSDLNPAVQKEVSDLFRQLGGDMKQVDLKEVLDASNRVTFACCRHDDRIIGMALMCQYKVISGNKGWIEDVVVDSGFRGRGIGRKLMNRLLDEANKKDLSELLLFSADHRKAAIGLYTDLGFKRKDSGLYTLKMAWASRL